ncbi:MAG: hypothetical protein MJZ38_00235 [archaeon]|nr:hypothetical protein [archaeon]
MNARWIMCALALLAVAVFAANSVSPGYAYSSSVETSGGISATCNSVMIYDDGEEYCGPVVNLETKCKKVGSDYEFNPAKVSDGYSLKVIGNGYYALNVEISEASTFLPSVTLQIQGMDFVVPLTNGAGSLTVTSTSFLHDTAYGFKLFTPKCTGPSDELTLGTIVFTMVHLESQEVPAQLVINGTTVASGDNVVPIKGIVDSETAKEAIEEVNGGSETIPDSKKEDFGYHIVETDIDDPPTVLITYDPDDTNITEPSTSWYSSTEVNFTLTIPANTVFYLHTVVDRTIGLFVQKENQLDFTINGVTKSATGDVRIESNDRYLYLDSKGNLTCDQHKPGESGWIHTESTPLSIQVGGARYTEDYQLKLYVIMMDDPAVAVS